MKKNLFSLFSATIIAMGFIHGATSQSAAGPIFHDGFDVADFTGYQMPPSQTRMPLPKSPNWWSRASDKSIDIEMDEQNRFGLGTGNQVLRLERPVGTEGSFNLLSENFTPITAGVISFDFLVDSIAGTKGLLFTFATGVESGKIDSYNNSKMTGSLFILDGTINRGKSTTIYSGPGDLFTFNKAQKNTLTIVFNNSSSLYSYGSEEVVSGTMHVLLNGVFQASWAISEVENSDIGDAVNGLWLQFPSASSGLVRLDNITVIPEPGLNACVLTGLGVIGALAGRKALR